MTVELQAAKGKTAEIERHLLCRVALLERISHDPRFCALAGEVMRETGLDRLHLAANKELIAGGPANGEALSRYMAAWDNPEIEQAIAQKFGAYVRGELRLSWPWLAPDLCRVFYFSGINALSRVKKVDIEYQFLTAKGLDGGRYQSADEETLRCYVQWFYRHRIKNPPEKIKEIAASSRESHRGEFLKSAGKNKTETVRSALKRVEKTLARMVPLKELAR